MRQLIFLVLFSTTALAAPVTTMIATVHGPNGTTTQWFQLNSATYNNTVLTVDITTDEIFKGGFE